MIRTLEIQFPVNFDERYSEYRRAKILGAQKKTSPNLATDFNATRKAQTEALKRALAKGEEKEERIREVAETFGLERVGTQLPDERPFCLVDGKLGYLKFNKNGKKITIGGSKTQPFRLLQCLTEPFSTAKSVDTVFEAIRENMKRKSKSGVYAESIDKAQKIKTIGNAIKDLQKGNKLQGKLEFKWDNLKTKYWLEYIG